MNNSRSIFELAAAETEGEAVANTELQEFLIELPEEQRERFCNLRNFRKYTPLHVAIFHRRCSILKTLLEFGANVNQPCHGTPPIVLLMTIRNLPGGREFADEAIEAFLNHPDLELSAKDDQGFTAMHWAAEYNFADIASKIIAKFDTLDGDCLDMKDRLGFRPVHRAAARDSIDVLRVLMEAGAKCTEVTFHGYTILHSAAMYGSLQTWDFLQNQPFFEALSQKEDKFGKTAIAYKNSVRLYNNEAPTTAIHTDYMCFKHFTCPPKDINTANVPPENVRRLEVLINELNGCLWSAELSKKLMFQTNSTRAPLADVLRVHEWSYIRKVQAECEKLDKDANSELGMGSLDGDTTISRHTFHAALHAAGAACDAVDSVMSGRVRNAFCPVRPPGHHAGPEGAVAGESGSESHGFCFINNISVAAAYAMNRYRDKVKRVAIVDFDVHHGNGTEETIRWLKPSLREMPILNSLIFGNLMAPRFKPWFDKDDCKNVLFVSVHGYGPRDRGLEAMFPRGAFYPGSGRTALPRFDLVRHDSIDRVEVKSENDDTMQREPSLGLGNEGEVFQGDAGSGEDSGSESENNEQDNGDMNQGNENNEEDEEGDEDFEAGSHEEGDDDDDDEEVSEGGDGTPLQRQQSIDSIKETYKTMSKMQPLILDVGVALPESEDMSHPAYRHQWRNYFRDEIFPRLEAFEPDLILISAGFDAHKKDGINGGYIALIEEDFEWVTTHLVRIANSTCDGRVVSVLEGGYELSGEMCSAFAKSVKTHVSALATGAKAQFRYDSSELQKEKEIEARAITLAEERRARERAEEEARYAAMVAEYEARRVPADIEANAEGNDDANEDGEEQPVAADASQESGSPREENEDGNNDRRRRRAQVDYVALNAKIMKLE